MYIDSNLIPLAAIAVGLVIGVTKVLTGSISSYKLRAEQIKADAMVKAEEIRARNQLELEKLLRQDQGYSKGGSMSQNDPVQSDNESYNSRSRVRE